MSDQDILQRFIFEELDIRGELVYLDQSWQSVSQRHDYPGPVRKQLGEALAAVALLCATLKFEGHLILQIQSQGPLRTLVAQATHEGHLRGLARWEGEVPKGNLAEVFGEGQLVMTARNPGADPYQSIVTLDGENIAAALKRYFQDSEQLRSAFWLFVSEQRVCGLFLQQLPAEHFNEEDWQRIIMLADTISQDELMQLPARDILHRLFHEETVKLLPAQALSFKCSCSVEKIASSLVSMGRDALREIIDAEGAIKVDCEFCREHYHFSPADIDSLFAISEDGPRIVH